MEEALDLSTDRILNEWMNSREVLLTDSMGPRGRWCFIGSCLYCAVIRRLFYEGDSISKLQIVIEKNRMEIMTYKQHLFFNIISIQI